MKRARPGDSVPVEDPASASAPPPSLDAVVRRGMRRALDVFAATARIEPVAGAAPPPAAAPPAAAAAAAATRTRRPT